MCAALGVVAIGWEQDGEGGQEEGLGGQPLDEGLGPLRGVLRHLLHTQTVGSVGEETKGKRPATAGEPLTFKEG